MPTRSGSSNVGQVKGRKRIPTVQYRPRTGDLVFIETFWGVVPKEVGMRNWQLHYNGKHPCCRSQSFSAPFRNRFWFFFKIYRASTQAPFTKSQQHRSFIQFRLQRTSYTINIMDGWVPKWRILESIQKYWASCWHCPFYQAQCTGAAWAARSNGKEADERIHDRQFNLTLCLSPFHAKALIFYLSFPGLCSSCATRCTRGWSRDALTTAWTISQQSRCNQKKKVA